MIEKFIKNANVEKFTNMLGIAVRLIVIDPFSFSLCFPSLRWKHSCYLSYNIEHNLYF